jgi:hypothetical protein
LLTGPGWWAIRYSGYDLPCRRPGIAAVWPRADHIAVFEEHLVTTDQGIAMPRRLLARQAAATRSLSALMPARRAFYLTRGTISGSGSLMRDCF